MILSHRNTHSNVMLHKSFHVCAHRGAGKDVPTSPKSSNADLATFSNMANKADPRSASPHGKRASPLTVREAGSQHPPKPPRLTPSPTPSVSPLLKRRKAEAGRTSPALNIPTILVEDEPMEVDCDADRSRRKGGKVGKSKKGRSPEEGRTTEGSGLCESLDKAATSADKFSHGSYRK